jgi:hypothetical protein
MRVRQARHHRAGLLLAALRYRSSVSLALLGVAVVATAAAVIGPVYLAAADDSVLTTTVRAATGQATYLALEPTDAGATLGQLDQAATHPPRAGGRVLYGRPLLTLDAGVSGSLAGTHYRGDVVFRSGACTHLRLVAGRCPSGTRQALVSRRTAALLGLRVGSVFTTSVNRPGSLAGRTATLRVSGLFQVPDPNLAYWAGTFLFGYGSLSKGIAQVDAFFVTKVGALSALRDAGGTAPLQTGAALLQLPLTSRPLRTADVAGLPAALSAYQASVARRFGVAAEAGIDPVLAAAAHEENLMGSIVGVVVLQLVLLALLGLYTVAARAAEGREPELSLARLRGLTVRATLVMALLEPAVVLAAALPIGLLLGWVLVRLLAAHLLATGTPVGIPVLAVGAALATFAGGVVALGAASWRLVRPPAERAGAERESVGRTGRWTAALEAVVVVLAVAGVVELASTGVGSGAHSDPLAAFTPGLLAAAAAVVGTRLLPLACRSLVPPTRESRFVATFLAVRQLARRPAMARQIPLLAVACGLASFAVAGWVVAAHNRATQAGFRVGAAEVLTVRPAPGVVLQTAVRRADPGGREAMAAVVFSSPAGQLLALDTTRFAAVASWPPGISRAGASAVAAALDPPTAPEVDLTGSEVRLRIDDSGSTAVRPQLQLTLFGTFGQQTIAVDTRALRAGSHTYTASLAGECPSECRLVSLGPLLSPEDRIPVRLSVAALSVRSPSGHWAPVDADLSRPAAWTYLHARIAGPPGSSAGLAVTFVPVSTGEASTVSPDDLPALIPAVATPVAAANDSPGDPPPQLSVEGIDGNPLTVAARIPATSLPRIGDDAVLVALTLADRAQSGPASDTTDEVWLAHDAGAPLLRRLGVEGLTIVSADRSSTLVAVSDHGGTALSYALFLLAAAGAAALAVGAGVFAGAVAGRTRSTELAGLQAVGIPRAVLRRALRAEQWAVTGTAVVLGVGSGVLAARLALPSIPELDGPGAGPPLLFGLPWALLAAVAVGALAVLGVVAEVSARAVLRAATPDQLRVEAR